MKNTRIALTIASLAVVAAAAGVAAQQTRDAAGTPAKGTGVISGVLVTDEASPQPVRRATVMLVAEGAGQPPAVTYTDESGRFRFAELPAGIRYLLTASKPPFLEARYGVKRPGGQPTPITLKTNEQLNNVTLRMTRGAVLSGRITDENGAPVQGISVRAMQLRVQGDQRTFVTVAASGTTVETTDDRGLYRFYGLPAGEYAITATPRVTVGEVRAMTETEIRNIMLALQEQRAASAAAQQGVAQPGAVNPQAGRQPAPTPKPDPDRVTVAYAPVFFPGTSSASSAQTVQVGAGDERTGLDFSLRLVRTASVEGTVVLPEGIAPQSVQLMMLPAGPDAGSNLAGIETLMAQRVAVGPDGRFRYAGVVPGQYTIQARAVRGSGAPPPPPPAPGAATQIFNERIVVAGAGETMMVMPDRMGNADPNAVPHWANADITVDGTPIDGVSLALQPGMTVSGRIEFRSSAVRPGGDFNGVQLNLQPAQTGGGPIINIGSTSLRVDEKGNFTISGVVPGRYRINGAVRAAPGSGPGPAWRLGSAILRGQDVLDFPIEIRPNENLTGAVVTFIDYEQSVTGVLQDASGTPAPDYTIVLFPADKRYWLTGSRRVRSARPATDGRYAIRNLPAGEYRMVAVTDLLPAELGDPSFLEQLVQASFPLTIAVGENKTQDLKISGGL